MRSVRQRVHAFAWLLFVWLATTTTTSTTIPAQVAAGKSQRGTRDPRSAFAGPSAADEAGTALASATDHNNIATVDLAKASSSSFVPVPASILRKGVLGHRASVVESFRFSAPPFVARNSATSATDPKRSSPPPPETSFEPSVDDMTLSPIVLVVTVDGHVHALKRDTGDWLWTLHDDSGHAVGGKGAKDVPFGSPLVSTRKGRPPTAMMPSRRGNSSLSPDPISAAGETQTQARAPSSVGGESFDPVDDELYVIEPTAGGQIYLYDRSQKDAGGVKLEKLPLSMQELVALSPFTFPSDSSRMFMGGSDSKIVAVDLRSGRLVGVFGSGGAAWCEWDPTKVGVKPDSECDDEISRRPQDLLYMGRTEYTLSIYSKTSSVPIQTLTYTTYTSSALGIALQSQWTHTPDSLYLQPMHDGSLVCFKVGEPGIKWSVSFDAPAVSVFDIALPAASPENSDEPNREFDAPLMFEQPHPLVVDGLPLDFHRWSQLPDTTYVGRVGDGLFAMSRDRYPLTLLSPWGALDGSTPDRETLEPGQDGEEALDGEMGPQQPVCQGLDCLVGRYPVLDSHIAPVGPDSAIDPPTSRLLIDGPRQTGPSVPSIPNRTSPLPRSRSSVLGQVLAPFIGGESNGVVVILLLAILGYFYARKASGRSSNSLADTVNTFMQRIRPDPAVVESAPNKTRATVSSSKQMPPKPSSDTVEVLPPSPVPHPLRRGAVQGAPSSHHSLTADRNDDGEGEGNDSDGKDEVEDTPRKKSRRRRGKKHKKSAMGELNALGGSSISKGTSLETLLVGEVGGVGSQDLGAITLSEVEVKEENGEEGDNTLKSVGLHSVEGLNVSDTILGYGSHGTVVLRGEFQGRAVAVKRLLKDFVTIATHEVALLQESDDHPHVIRYYCKEHRDTFLYIALELCPASLFDLIDQPSSFPELVPLLDQKRALRQITSGIRHLHKLKIVHRDIKPQNILVSTSKHHGGLRMLISDFGLCKKLDVDESSFQQTMNHAAGSFGYRAPEVLRGLVDPEQESVSSTPSSSTQNSPSRNRGSSSSSSAGLLTDPSMRLTRSIDIFSLGCIVYYVLTGGEHPFGGRYEREMNILLGKISLERLDGLGEEAIEVQDLISRMVATDPRERPSAEAVLLHPFFWNAQKRLLFICDASDRFEIMERDPPTPTLVMLESRAIEIVGDDWQKAIDRNLLDNLGKYRKYDGKSVRDLLRVLRNKKHHYQDLPDSVRRNLGELPGGFLSYFTLRFPHLLLHVYDTVATHLHDEPMFASTFSIPDEEQ
ncbi:IRE protein kinase [Microbotryum lychnidis-dioicae p1A1 Lamole]|uniref:non-specific serine/threonine protein kinase n=1 Tax=Microbotryum lychnidis-dioicae (strain p1A1 Lamole / MvSl-1064) TaxID=683840 RepID=U5HIY2_USTV1|nr:IRE protein kinase [Microbotryum lychnidis-dioicae p1A1 Lamole]|eukprot:KDE02470.1 IRE protein kinase [Microbotryum lychnidis-dioicae p1A1 Lamole]